MRMLFGVMLLVLWPFHRHTPVVEQHKADGTDHLGPGLECERDDRGEYLFVGPDAMLGISIVSCDAAFEDWRHNYPPPALSRV